MLSVLQSDLLRTASLVLALIGFPVFIQDTPPPAGLVRLADWEIIPLNQQVASRYYDQALISFQHGNIQDTKAYVTAAIVFDSEPFSQMYKEFIQKRTEWMSL